MGDKKNWGKGYGNEASRRIFKYCFEELKLNEITLGVIKDNDKAVRLYKNNGFLIYNNLSNSLRMSLDVKNFK